VTKLRSLRSLGTRLIESKYFVLYLAFVLVRLFPFLLYLVNFGVQIAPDSGTYRYGFLDWGVLGNHRGYGITVPFTLCPNDLFIVCLQFTLVTIAGVMLLSVLVKGSTSRLKYIPILAVFVTLNSPTIAIWDTWVLSHSISLAYNLFSFVFLLKYLESKALKHLVAFASFLFLSSLSRPNNQAVLVMALFFIFIHFLVLYRLNRKRFYTLTKIILIFAFLITVSLAINSNLGKKSIPTVSVAMLPYLLDISAPISEDLIQRSKLDTEIPPCTFPSRPLVNGNGDYFKKLKVECPQGVEWLESNFQNWYIEFLITTPSATMKALSYGASVGLGYPINYGDTFPTVIPEPVLKLFVGAPKVSNVKPGIYPFFGWMLLVLFTGIQVKLRRRKLTKHKSNQKIEILGIVYLSWIASSIVSIIYQSHSDAYRVFIDNQVIIILFSTYLVFLNLVYLRKMDTKAD
jgi:hypothetical protein